MLHYGIGEGRIRRIIRTPARIEEGIAENTIAAMQPTGVKGQHEMWVMYTLVSEKKQAISNNKFLISKDGIKKIRVITVWRYPGKSPARNPIPKDIIDEVRQLV